MDVIELNEMDNDDIVERLECHMCDLKARFFIGPYLWCGEEDCGKDIYEIQRD